MLTVILTILIFLVLISLHEFGHFIMAKLSGVGVYEFSIGMGPALFKKQKGETLYSVRALPIGGYCRLEGEDEESESERAFTNQKWWKRFLVISAGAVLNILLGFLIFIVIVSRGDYIATTEIKSVEDRAYIAESGIMPGDKIIEINGRKVSFYNDISYNLSRINIEENIEVTVKRGEEELTFSFMPSEETQTISYEEEGAAIVTDVNGEIRQSYVVYSEEEKEAIREHIGEQISSTRHIIGFMPKTEEVSFRNIIPEAYHYTVFVSKLVYHALSDLITGKTGIEQFSGPVGIATAVDDAVNSGSYGLENILSLVAMLTINLGIFNLLPLPALDGGRLFFLLVELVIRKPVPPEKEGLIHSIGMILLLILAAVVLFNDIMKLV